MNKLLFTGTNGFLGKSILPLLKNSSYTVTTLDIANADINSNLSADVPELSGAYNIVLHAAGKAHSVPKTEAEKQLFFDVNYQGTVNLCKALEKSGIPQSFIFISTVAVYGYEYGEDITEEAPLNGNTPYALSKIQAENFLMDWCNAHRVNLTILRPSLLAGPNPPGNLGAMIQGIKTGRYFSIGGGEAQKSVLMVQDIARLLPLVSEKGGIYNVCDSHQASFGELEVLISSQLNKKRPLKIPYWMAKSLALAGDLIGNCSPINSSKLKKITNSLTFSNQKARTQLNWEPLEVLSNFKIA